MFSFNFYIISFFYNPNLIAIQSIILLLILLAIIARSYYLIPILERTRSSLDTIKLLV